MKTKMDIPEIYPEQDLAQQSSLHINRKRIKLFASIFFLVFFIILCRAVIVLTSPPSAETLRNLASRQYNSSLSLSPYRGTIFDRRSEPLAISIRKPSLFVNPRVFDPKVSDVKTLSKILQVPRETVKKIADKDAYFYWLKRKVSPFEKKQVKKLNLKGLHFIQEPSRYYPSGLASQLVGYVGIDNKGLLGLEKIYDDVLRGYQNETMISRDAKGRMIHSQSASAAPQKPGEKLYLAIDRVIQEITERSLAHGVQRAKAKSGFAIVSDPHTGHLLAVANYPKFNPNDSKTITNFNTRNFALLDLFEPGSVVKPLIVGQAIDQKLTSLQEVFHVDGGVYKEDNWRIRDTHGYEQLSTEEIITKSSNIGAYKIAKRLGKKGLLQAYLNFGVSDRALGLGFTHQAFGRILSWEKWRDIRFANIAFGQGLMMSGLEIVQAFGSIANGGQLMKPILITKIQDDTGRVTRTHPPQILKRTLSLKTARLMRQALEQAVEKGTGHNAASQLYTTAGKTGTTEKIDPQTKSYSQDLRIASFAGFAPVSDPHLVIYVLIDEPGIKPYYGGTWAAPVFKAIAEDALKYLNVAPDKSLHLNKISQKKGPETL